MSFRKRQAKVWLYLLQLRKTGWLTDEDNYHHTKLPRAHILILLLIAVKYIAILQDKTFQAVFMDLYNRYKRVQQGCKLGANYIRQAYAVAKVKRDAYRLEHGLPDDSATMASDEYHVEKARELGILAEGDDSNDPQPPPEACEKPFRVPADWRPSDPENIRALEAAEEEHRKKHIKAVMKYRRSLAQKSLKGYED